MGSVIMPGPVFLAMQHYLQYSCSCAIFWNYYTELHQEWFFNVFAFVFQPFR